MKTLNAKTILLFLCCITALQAQTVDKFRDAFKENLKAQNQTTVLQFVKIALKENRAAETLAALKPWFQNNPISDASLIFQLAQSYREAGQLKEAVRYYQRYLALHKLNSTWAGISIDAVYSLLLTQMRDSKSTYNYINAHAAKLRKYGSAQKHDHWFLKLAVKQKDLLGLVEYLQIVYKDNKTDHAPYEIYLTTTALMLRQIKAEPEVYAALKGLSAIPALKNWGIKLNWLATVLPYIIKLDDTISKTKKNQPIKGFDSQNTENMIKMAQQRIALDKKEGLIIVVKDLLSHHIHAISHRRIEIHGSLSRKLIMEHLLKGDEQLLERFLKTTLVLTLRASPTPLVSYFPGNANNRKLLLRYAKFFNRRNAPNIPLFDKTLTVKTAKELAPHLRANSSMDAGVIRAFAAAGPSFPPTVAELVKNEMWRYTRLSDPMNHLWRNGSKRDGDFRKLDAQYKDLSGSKSYSLYKELLSQTSKDTPSQTRLNAFLKTWNDSIGANPTIMNPGSILTTLMQNADNKDKDQMFSTIINNEGRGIDLMNKIISRATLTIKGKKPITIWLNYWDYRNLSQHYRRILPKTVAKLNKVLRAMLAKGPGVISRDYFAIWCNVQGNSKDDLELMKKIAKDPAFPSFDRFTGQAYSMFRNTVNWVHIKETKMKVEVLDPELRDLSKGALPPQVFAAFNTAVERMAKNKKAVMLHWNTRELAKFPAIDDKTRKNMLRLFTDLIPESGYHAHSHQVAGYEQLATRLVEKMQADKKWNDIYPCLAAFISLADTNSRYTTLPDTLVDFGEAALSAEKFSVAAAIGQYGTYSKVKKTQISRFRSLLSKAAAKMGLSEIPVDKDDPAFSIFKSQAEYMQGNETAAWSLFMNQPEQVGNIVRKLNPDYSFWVIEKSLLSGNVSNAKKVGQELHIWSVREKGSLDFTQEGKLKLAMGDIAFKDGNYVRAKSHYQKLTSSRAYHGSDEQFQAYLGIIKIDMATRNYSAALSMLENLLKDPDKQRRYLAHQMSAVVYYKQGNYSSARKEIKAVLDGKADYKLRAEAMILKGELDVKERNFDGGREIEVGDRDSQYTIIPGQPITISLIDYTLTRSGVSSTIEVEIRSKSGDLERILLRQESEESNLFKARIVSELGKPKKGDKILQVLGKDEITYGYSARYRKKMSDLPKENGIVMTIKSNASFDMTAGAFPTTKGLQELDLSTVGKNLAQQLLGAYRVRPGNPIYLRVKDADKSKTAQIDTVKVSLKTTSGDHINSVTLSETSPYSGVFEGTVPTASAITTATASDSEQGTDPNDAITPLPNRAWKGDAFYKAKQGKVRYLKVDFNDKIALGPLQVKSAAQGALTSFYVQTSNDGSTWTNKGSFPTSPMGWDGLPEMTLISAPNLNFLRHHNLPTTWSQMMSDELLNSPYLNQKVNKFGSWKGKSPADSKSLVLVRFRALFFQKDIAMRTFQLSGYPVNEEGYDTIFILNGTTTGFSSESNMLTRQLKPGLHEIQVWRLEKFDTLVKHNPQLLCDFEESDTLQPCPDNMFQQSSFPELIQKSIPKAVQINKKSKTEFNIDFGSIIETRAFRICIVKHEGTTPIVDSLHMTDRTGKKVLPASSDYRKLRSNETLEVLPGDKISALYTDDNFIGMGPKNKEKSHGAVLSVAFSDATIAASFLKYQNSPEGRVLVLEDIRRFKMGAAVAFIITDPDMDISEKRDQVSFSVITSNGFKQTLKALESEEHSGEFHGRFYPQLTQSTRPAEIEITKGATITAIYRDADNTIPGYPVDRKVTIEHAKYVTPEISAYTVKTSPYTPPPLKVKPTTKKKKTSRRPVNKREAFALRRAILTRKVMQKEFVKQKLDTLLNSSVGMTVKAPHLALANSSNIFFYVQTESGRKLAKSIASKKGKKTPVASASTFNLNIPGTLKIATAVSSKSRISLPKCYTIGGSFSSAKKAAVPKVNRNLKGSNLDRGVFSNSVRLQLAKIPMISYANRASENMDSNQIPEFLAIHPNDTVYIAYPYFEKEDFYDNKKEGRIAKWSIASYSLKSHVFLDVMNSSYSDTKSNAFVGEKIYVRIVASGLDNTDNRDSTQVHIKSSTGAECDFTIWETETHSGVFKGVFRLSYLEKDIKVNTDGSKPTLPAIEMHGFPVRYGDSFTVSYPKALKDTPEPISVQINKGSNGIIEPYSKLFADNKMAISTSFTMAECYFEMARTHKKQKDESLARRKMKHAEKLLQEALASHRDEDQQAHAEYLLGNLAQEYASLSKNDTSRKNNYSNAISRYKKVVTDYSDADYAAKAQYKIAFVYDKMDKIEGLKTMENAIDEYVKLAYKYPEDELIPKVMARIGKYFQKRGKGFRDIATDLDKKGKKGDGAAIMSQARNEYLKAANVYAKIRTRFPSNPLASWTRLASAQCYMLCDYFNEALEIYTEIYQDEEMDGETQRAQAMYWSGFCYEKMFVGKGDAGNVKAVRLYNTIRYQYSASVWAKYARGRLVDPAMAGAIKREEERKERMMTAAKKR
jgi:tetratricopeptide (TPR) repeat protein